MISLDREDTKINLYLEGGLKMAGKRFTFLIVLTVLVSLFMYTNEAESAVCAFRNPDRDLYALFPDATGYRTVFKELNNSNKNEIEAAVGQLLDLNDIGTHTLYIVLKGEEPIGFIHPHAEWGAYGLMELIFAFELDGTIKDFLVQRSRERKTREIQSESFRRQFRGKGMGDIGLIKPPKGAEKGASAVILCAKKIFIFNKFLFGKEIEEVRKSKDTT